MGIHNIVEYKEEMQLLRNKNVKEKILIAKDKTVKKSVLKLLATDSFWLVRLYAVMNERITIGVLQQIKNKEKNEIVLNQINFELSFRNEVAKIRGI